MKTKEAEQMVCQAQIGGLELCFKTGKLAKQAGGAVLIQYGDTVVLGTANMSKPLYDDGDFLPLLVDYEEKFYAAGKIKGSRFIKREGRPSDEATITARLVDRSIRPLFPEGMINDVQVVLTVLSYDGENDPDVAAINAASVALAISDVPWDGPVAAVRIGRTNGEFIVNPTHEERETGDLDLVVVGTGDRVVMIEAGAKEVPKDDLLDAIEEAQKALGKIVETMSQLVKSVGKAKKEATLEKSDKEVASRIRELATKGLTKRLEKALTKEDFKTVEGETAQEVAAALSESEKETITDTIIAKTIHEMRGDHARQRALSDGWREGGRALDEVRPLAIEVGLLPRTHGSGLFQRGETQVLTVATLGGPSDMQFIDTMEIDAKKHYIHYYNFPSFSVGENKPNRGPGRREIGHGSLAERALVPVLPDREKWPYTMLLVSEVLESNGSSSMASVCGSTLALMDAGVPISKPVAGIAMGLFSDGKGGYSVLTDIAGVEDEKGDMDFKIAGTRDGITALQMDIKVEGITREILSAALDQALQARESILDQMEKVIAKPRAELSPYAPRIETIRVDVEKIGDLIGPKGKHINEIIEETGVEIDIDDDGLVSITSNDSQAMQKAIEWVHNMTRVIKAGEKFEGRVTRILDFGAMVELTPNTTGMVHISQFREERIDKVSDVVKVGDVIPVVVLEIDDMGRINLSHKAALPGGSAVVAKSPSDRGPHQHKRRSMPFRGPKPPG